MMDGPIITLTTDFGLADHYVGVMKGVILSRCPQARIIDISHEVAAFSIWSAAYLIDQAAPYFPARTIHVVVIDPGVGTSRKPLIVEALGQTFIAPDNGVLAMILARDPHAHIREITNTSLWLGSPSSTFHGRDIFSPVAAALAANRANLKEVGPRLHQVETLAGLFPIETEPGAWEGRVLSVDRFGNLITNFKSSAFRSHFFTLGIGKQSIADRYETFGAAQPGHLFSYFGSSGYIEIGLNQESAAGLLKAHAGDPVTLHVSIVPE
jgi:S-adenosylmethionine hydrolase